MEKKSRDPTDVMLNKLVNHRTLRHMEKLKLFLTTKREMWEKEKEHMVPRFVYEDALNKLDKYKQHIQSMSKTHGRNK